MTTHRMTLADARRLERQIVAAGGPRNPNDRALFARIQAHLDMAESASLGGPLAVIGYAASWAAAGLIAIFGATFAAGVASRGKSLYETGQTIATGVELLAKVVIYGGVVFAAANIVQLARGRGLLPTNSRKDEVPA